MKWVVEIDMIKDDQGNLIGILYPNVDPFYLSIIKRTPTVVSLAKDFEERYLQKKPMTMNLYKKFEFLVRPNEDYNFIWKIDIDNNLIDGYNNKICYSPRKDNIDFFLIQFVPEILLAVKESMMDNFNSSGAKLKPLYETLKKIIKRIDE